MTAGDRTPSMKPLPTVPPLRARHRAGGICGAFAKTTLRLKVHKRPVLSLLPWIIQPAFGCRRYTRHRGGGGGGKTKPYQVGASATVFPPPPHPSATRDGTPQSSVSASFPLRYRPGVPLPSPLLWLPAAPPLLHAGSSSPSSLPVSRRCSFETITERFE